jgi:hypothetical protein
MYIYVAENSQQKRTKYNVGTTQYQQNGCLRYLREINSIIGSGTYTTGFYDLGKSSIMERRRAYYDPAQVNSIRARLRS